MKHLCISVIISTYNRADLLPEAIDSLLSQTRIPDEIIVVDDGSVDNTPEVLAQYGLPVIAIRQDNQGLAAGRNTGLRAAAGDLIAFLDSDDMLTDASIEKRARFLEASGGYDVVYSNVLMTDTHGQPLCLYTEIRPGKRPSGRVFAHFALYNLMPVHAFMFRRTCLGVTGPFDETLASLEDYDLWLRMAAHFEFAYLDEPLAHYRLHPSMMTVKHQERMQRDELRVHSCVFDMLAFKELTRAEQARVYSAHGKRHGSLGDMRQARRCFWEAIRLSPASTRPYIFMALTLIGRRGFSATLNGYGRLRGDKRFFGPQEK
ncbi:MAG: glycosyltransferase [Anaerolineales bacterium]|nr:glycosyltransferase [Anaerolineales bacterium]